MIASSSQSQSQSQLNLFESELHQFSNRYGRELSPQQAKVRDHGAGNQVVVAGAGTGKTEALIQRILKLLVEGDEDGPVELQQILALTFTEKGANEMFERVYGRLVNVLRDSPQGPERHRLEAIRANFTEVSRISTFDAFNMRMVQQFGNAGDAVAVIDASQRSAMRREVTTQFWNRVESTFNEDQKFELWEFLEVFSSRAAALEAIASLAEEETEEVLRDLASLPDEQEWHSEFARLVSRDGEAMWLAIEKEVLSLKLPADLQNELLDPARVLAPSRSGIVTKDDWSAAFVKRWSPELFPGLSRVARKMIAWKAEISLERDPELDWRSRRAIALLCRHALWWRSARLEWCAEHSVASFSDISTRAIELLQNSGVAARMRDGIRYLLVDEFQDTNWRQWALIEALRDKRHGNVLIVGDEKQAIFRFRGGDITVFDGVRRILLGDKIEADELTISQRSTRQLVDWVNSVFRSVLPSNEARQPYEAPFQALQSQKQAPNGLWRIEPACWHNPEENAIFESGKRPMAEQRQRSARSLARFLRELCDDAETWNVSKEFELSFPGLADISQKIAKGENAICVIFTTHEVKSMFEAELRAFDVPFVSVRGRGFWSSQPLAWTQHLLRLLSDPTDRLAFVALSRSPLGGLSDVALLEWHLALQSETERSPSAACDEIEDFTPSLPQDAQAWSLWISRLREWRDLTRVEPVSEVLEVVLESSETAFYEAGLPDAAQREQNWRKIVDLVREREGGGEGGVPALVNFFEEMTSQTSAENDAEAPLPEGGSIQLMTVFASKGLGFPMTILPELDGTPQTKATLLQKANWEGMRQMAFRLTDDEDDKNAPKPWLWEKIKAQNIAEEEAQWRRLFYVACTRAESHLVLVLPENVVSLGAAWVNLCDDGVRLLTEIHPTAEIAQPRIHQATGIATEPQWRPELAASTPIEWALSDLVGERANQFASKARRFMETRLQSDAGQIREELPFCAPAQALGFDSDGWILGAWEWLALEPNGEVIVAASSETRKQASQRVSLMRLAALDVGLQVHEAWALWPDGEQTGAVLVAN